MFPGMELMGCQGLAVPAEVMQHVVRVESSFNPYAIGVVGGRLVRQPNSLPEALATAKMLEQRGYNFSVGLAQVNRENLLKYGLGTYEKAFQPCPNLQAGSRILAECYSRSNGDWPKSFSCYYSGDFKTGFRHGYVQRIYTSIRKAAPSTGNGGEAIPLVDRTSSRAPKAANRSHPWIAPGIGPLRAGGARTGPAPQFAQTEPRSPVRVSLVAGAGTSSADEGSGAGSTKGVSSDITIGTTGEPRQAGDAAFVF